MLICRSDVLTQPELAELTAVTRQFGQHFHTAGRVSGGFSDASVYRIEVAGQQPLAVRRTPTTSAVELSRLTALHHLLRHVSQRGVTEVPVPLTVEPGPGLPSSLTPETIVRRPSGWWHVEPWLPGSACAGQQLSAVQIDNAVELIHRFHTAAADFAARQTPDCRFSLRIGISPAVTRRLELVERLAAGDLWRLQQAVACDQAAAFATPAGEFCSLLEKAVPRLLARLRSLARRHFPLQPVIRDLWSAHILFTEDRVTGLIDLTAGSTDHVAVDLARLQRSWFAADSGRICSLISRWQRLRPFSAAEYELLSVLDESSVFLSPCTWLQRRYREHQTLATSRPLVVARFRSLVQVATGFEPL